MRIVKPSVELLTITTNSAQLIEQAGRTCYKSEDKITDDSADKFVAMINKRGHVSVIEHASATFRIVTDRGISHEIVRHRLASYSQESTRYCNYGKKKFSREITVVKPSGVGPRGSESDINWFLAMENAEESYLALLDAGMKPQTARSVLPMCLKTEIVMTCNFREWCHFLKLRLAPAAHPDIRLIALRIWKVLVTYCPPVFGRFAETANDVSCLDR